MEQTITFSELLESLITNQVNVTIGAGESELNGTILAFDPEPKVLTYRDSSSGTLHFIPLTSVRSIGVDETTGGLSCFLDLYRK
ncbi:hypothetical protein MJA45_03220 [Paenibacillus aurantius]|uniref:Uncharacterized protein n=1 Tax=Paenibacillus aurantius TaxID=2918900 RepID=A0AA96RG23_9BACL|nr:hypothetical protein [Paenibacillus aurantius]WNQ12086.1 hypothetical protein MJA45_03220 [Paenibacillus aurantius]